MAALIIAGGPILTLDAEGSVAEALAVVDGRIAAVGRRREIEVWRGPHTDQLDLAGRALLPGFVDHHVHLLNMGMSLRWAREAPAHVVDLAGVTSEAEIGRRLAERARGLRKGSWLIGKGWSQAAWGSGELPNHHVLTTHVPDNPVYLTRVDGHAGWSNAVALQRAGVDRSTSDPPGGVIRRLPDGEPSGVLMERANERVTALLPTPGDDEVMAAFRLATEALAAQGVTEVFDAGFLAVPGVVDLGLDFERYLGLLVRLDNDRPLAVRVNLMIPAPSELVQRFVDDPEFERVFSPRLRVTHVKLFMDGALGSRGALLSHPYADDPATHGVRRMRPDELREAALEALDSGLDVGTHVIGDLAVSDALDVYTDILTARPEIAPERLRLEHFSYAREEDFDRAAYLGIVLSIQPNFVFPGDDGRAMEDARVGVQNSDRVYAWGRLRDLGATLAFGSDYFTRPFAPLYTVHAAATRCNSAGLPKDGWHPAERLDRLEALRLATTLRVPGAAEPYAPGWAVGETADFVVLSADPVTVSAGEILGTTVLATYLEGEPTFVAARKRP